MNSIKEFYDQSDCWTVEGSLTSRNELCELHIGTFTCRNTVSEVLSLLDLVFRDNHDELSHRCD